ncbi:MAG: TolC family protein, partial [Syntrophus sp. (in: bacteria)]
MKNKSKWLVVLAWGILIALICNGRAVAVEYTWEDLCRMTLERSEKIKIMEDYVSIARTGKDKKMSALIPKLTAYGSYTDWTESKYSPANAFTPTLILPGTVIQPNSGTAWGVRLDQSITLNGKEITDYSISKDNIERQQNETNAQKEEYLMTVSAAFYEMLRAQKVLEIANSTVERLTAYRKAAEKRLKVGEVTKTVLLRADGELSGALSDQIKAKNVLDLSRAILARIVGITEDFTLKEKFLEDAPLPPLDSYVAMGLAKRAEMKGVEIEKQMTKDQIRVAKGGYWPILS